MEKDEYSARGIFPATSRSSRRSEINTSGSIGPAPLGAPGIVDLVRDYAPLREKLNDLFDRLSTAAQKRPGELVSVPFEGVDVKGGNYEHWFGTNPTITVRIDPTNFRNVVQPCLEGLMAEKRSIKNPGRNGVASTPENYVGLRKNFPTSFGAAKLATNVKQALEEIKLKQTPPQADGSYELTIDQVTFSVRLIGKSVYVRQSDLSAVAVLGARYDQEHVEYRQQEGNVRSTKGADRWQSLIAQQPGNDGPSRG